ncbi:MAG: polysaccharide deacetylase family protein [Rhizobiaceae bacterium]
MSAHSIDLKRWLAKKAARAAVGAVSMPLVASPSHRNHLRVLTYHRFAREARSPFSVSPEVLDRQMKWIAAGNMAAGLDAVADILAGNDPRRCRVVITIDDGDPTVISNAAPIFAKHGIPYAIYVVPGLLGRRRHMSAADLRELAAADVEIGSHTMTHRSLTSLSPRELVTELEASKKQIEDIVGKAVTSFAYPFGTMRDFDGPSAQALRMAGYRVAFTSQHGTIETDLDPMFLPRVKIEGGDPDWLFRASCQGAMDQWRFVDQGMAGLQRPQAKDLDGVKEADVRA